ncbi:GatB/YqeY domain-containing protein [Candidatus Parcubacteria bacterium]|nr:GatB/YqeY domain-containing protein [Candidatus Parcubacteria bacterium]
MLLEDLRNDYKKSLKARDSERVSALRFLLSEIQNREIELRTQRELTDEDVQGVLVGEARKCKESIREFEKAERGDLIEKEKRELQIIGEYLPPPLDEDEVRRMVKQAITEVGAASLADLGKVIGEVMSQVGGRAEGSLVSELVKEELQ